MSHSDQEDLYDENQPDQEDQELSDNEVITDPNIEVAQTVTEVDNSQAQVNNQNSNEKVCFIQTLLTAVGKYFALEILYKVVSFFLSVAKDLLTTELIWFSFTMIVPQRHLGGKAACFILKT